MAAAETSDSELRVLIRRAVEVERESQRLIEQTRKLLMQSQKLASEYTRIATDALPR